jgi:SAM-dependent methyltransferase
MAADMQEQESKTSATGTRKETPIDCLMQNHHLTAALGGPIPKKVSMSEVQRILDVGCTYGEWAQEVVRLYPHVEVVGIDEDAEMLEIARKEVFWKGLAHRIFFRQMPLYEKLAFDDASFDLVHRRKNGSHPLQPALAQEMIRILRPSGWLNLVQYAPGLSSSEAFNTIERMGLRLLHIKHTGLAPEAHGVDAALRSYEILLDNYLFDVSYTVHAVDIGYSNGIGTREYVDGLLRTSAAFKDIFVRYGFFDAETYDQLLARARAELTDPYACGYTYLISTLGRKDG